MKKLFLGIVLLMSICINYSESSFLNQLQIISEQILLQSENLSKETILLRNIFTSCAEKHNKKEIRQACKDFLDTTFNNIEHMYTNTISWEWSTFDTLEKEVGVFFLRNSNELPLINWGDGHIDSAEIRSERDDIPDYTIDHRRHEYLTPGTYKVMLFYPESITQLELMEDNISTIQINNTLQNLGRLYISGNPLGEIKPGIFDNLPNLKQLLLRNIQLSQVGPLLFSGLDSLEGLDLGYNNLSSIDPNTFSQLKNLQFLSIKGNPFGKLKLSYFTGLEQLTEEGDIPSFLS